MPLNPVFLLTYNASAVLSPTGIQLRPQGGAPVAIDPVDVAGSISSWAGRPRAPLLPGTVYEILDPYTLPCQAAECNGGSPHVVATFTTGDAADTTPPTFGGLASIATSGAMPLLLGCTPGAQSYTFTLSWAAASDPGAASVRYHVYAGSERLASFVSGTAFQGTLTCVGTTATWAPSSRWSKPLTVRAVDQAGNEDPNQIQMSVNLSCEAPSDGGMGAGGASAVDAGTVPGAAGAGGAAAAGGRGGMGGGGGGSSGDTVDAAAPEQDAPVAPVDAAVSDPGAGGAGGTSAGTVTPPMSSGNRGSGGCSCDATANQAPAAGLGLIAAGLALVGTSFGRRRRRR